MANLFIGTSGFSYNHWKGVFYPEDVPASHWLEFYAQHFGTVELNNPFYRLPARQAFEKWAEQTPDDFVFAVKFSRFLTHIKRLKDPEEPLDRFMSRADALGRKLGPILFQLPPNFKPDLDRLANLLMLRPPDSRWVLEFRNPEWFSDEVLDLLREHGTALCVQDSTEGCPTAATARFAYVRFHGTPTANGSYDKKLLRSWAHQFEQWLGDGIDVYAYFNNDMMGYAVKNAMELINLAAAHA